MRSNTERQNARIAQAVKRHETHKETAQAKAETRARRQARSAKYSTTKAAF